MFNQQFANTTKNNTTISINAIIVLDWMIFIHIISNIPVKLQFCHTANCMYCEYMCDNNNKLQDSTLEIAVLFLVQKPMLSCGYLHCLNDNCRIFTLT